MSIDSLGKEHSQRKYKKNCEYCNKEIEGRIIKRFCNISCSKAYNDDQYFSRKIEYDDSYWHSDAKTSVIRELARDRAINDMGFEVLHVAEHDFKTNKDMVLRQCLTFLNK